MKLSVSEVGQGDAVIDIKSQFRVLSKIEDVVGYKPAATYAIFLAREIVALEHGMNPLSSSNTLA